MSHSSNFPQNFAHRALLVVGIPVLLILVVFVLIEYVSAPNSGKYPNIVLEDDLKDSNTATLKIAEKIIQVDLASTPAQRAQGLSGRESLSDDRGMFFVFESSGLYGFWMADMFFPIDIIWINEEKKVVHMEKNVPPESFPKIFTPSEPAKYVLEVPAGFSDENGLMAGDEVLFF